MLAQLLTFKEDSLSKERLSPREQGPSSLALPAGWSCDLLPGMISMEMTAWHPKGFVCLEELLSRALNISLRVFLHFSDVQKLSGII